MPTSLALRTPAKNRGVPSSEGLRGLPLGLKNAAIFSCLNEKAEIAADLLNRINRCFYGMMAASKLDIL